MADTFGLNAPQKMAKSSRQLWTAQILEGGAGKNPARAKGAWTSESIDAAAARSSAYTRRKIDDAARAIGGEQIRGVVLGIDPSLRGTGLAAIEALGGGKMRYVDSETVRNPPSLSMAECIARIFERTLRMIDEYSPDWVSIEQSVYVQNFKTAMILGSARGAAIAAAAHRRREVYEYPPLRIKQAVIGYGRASKEQVGRSVMALLQMGEILPPDESDAGAAAITHIFTHKIRI